MSLLPRYWQIVDSKIHFQGPEARDLLKSIIKFAILLEGLEDGLQAKLPEHRAGQRRSEAASSTCQPRKPLQSGSRCPHSRPQRDTASAMTWATNIDALSLPFPYVVRFLGSILSRLNLK